MNLMLLLLQSVKHDSINTTGMCSALAACMHTHAHTQMQYTLFCIIWRAVPQGKAGLIEVIPITVWVDGTGNKDQGLFLHTCMCVYVYEPGSY